MITDLTVVEQRYKAVLEVVEHGGKIVDVALHFGVDRKTLYRWITRYEQDGLGALANKSSRPGRCPHQMSPEVEARIIELRKAHPSWGRAPSKTNFENRWIAHHRAQPSIAV